jgi:hypothetical protein
LKKVKKVKLKKKKKRRGRYKTVTSRKNLLKAIKGSGGQIGRIAKRLGVKYMTAWMAIQRADDDVIEALKYERSVVYDIAEETLLEMTQQRIHFPTAAKTAMWILSHGPQAEKRGYVDKREITIQGGKEPLYIKNEDVVSLDKLKSIPLEVRKQMLKEIEKEEKEEDS